MKKTILILIITLLNISNALAQRITDVKDLKKFYTEYFSYILQISDEPKLDSLVKTYCTKEFHKAWNEDVNEIGLYDPLTNGFGENPDLMKNTLVIKKESNSYIVSFNYLTWPDNKTMTESVIVYVNADGKISHTKRPSDGLL